MAANGTKSNQYDLVVVGCKHHALKNPTNDGLIHQIAGFAGSMTALNFLEQCKKENKNGRVALIEVGKEGERYGASR